MSDQRRPTGGRLRDVLAAFGLVCAAVLVARSLWPHAEVESTPEPTRPQLSQAGQRSMVGPESRPPSSREPVAAQALAPDAGRQPEPHAVSMAATPEWTRERIFEVAETHFRTTAQTRALVAHTFGPWLRDLPLEQASAELGVELTAAQYLHAKDLAAPWSSDLEALGQLYLDDHDLALRDIWANRRYSLEQPDSRGRFRDSLPGESAVLLPGAGFYYSMSPDQYPHLAEHQARRKQLKDSRTAAVFEYLRSL